MSGFEKLLSKFGGSEAENYSESSELPLRTGGSLEAFIQSHGHVSEEYHFYNNTVTLRFNKDEHRYYRIGELGNLIPLNSVTTAVGIIDKSHMLTPWAAKMMAQKLLRIMPTEMVEGIVRIKALTFEEFTTIVLEAKGAHKEKLDEASDIGHLAHKCLEESILHAMATDPEKIVRALINLPADEQAKNAANGGFNWMCRHNARWQETETKIYSLEHDYAGTMDGLALLDSCDDPACCSVPFKDRLSLTDWKSSNHLKIEYLFQTAGYKHAKMEMRRAENIAGDIADVWILRLGKSDEEAGKFEPWHMTPDEYEEDFQGFLACLSLTRLVDSVEERMKHQKGTIRSIKKQQRETAKALAKEQEKLQKAMDKASAKLEKEKEKVRIKAEAKLERERLKAEKMNIKGAALVLCDQALINMGVNHRVEVEQTVNLPVLVTIAGSIPAAPTTFEEETCTSTPEQTEELVASASDTTDPALTTAPPITTSAQSPSTPLPETPQPVSIISTEEMLLPAQKIRELQSKRTYVFEEPYTPQKFKLPMEG